jgi:hypothetical protein
LHARRFGAQELIVYLIDYDQSTLHPLPGSDAGIVPERMPSATAAGNPSLRKLPNVERAGLYTLA